MKGKGGIGGHMGAELSHTLGGALLSGLAGSSAADNDDGSTGSPNGKTASSVDGAKVKKLFSYSNAELIQGRAVTAMVWNAVSSDLLAVGYGKVDDFTDAHKPGESLDEERLGGLVLFWSLRNPDYPEKILRTPQPVTALDFSKQHPMTLAVGLLNGDVNVYDVRREGANWGVPVETSAGMHGGHTDPVWHLKWIVKGVERLETLVSISTDGRVLEWNLKKGLVVSTLMQLKKSGTVSCLFPFSVCCAMCWVSSGSVCVCNCFCRTRSSVRLLVIACTVLCASAVADWPSIAFPHPIPHRGRIYTGRGLDHELRGGPESGLPPHRRQHVHHRHRGRVDPPLLGLLQRAVSRDLSAP